MYDEAKETQCTHCDHRKVCSLKDQFLDAQKTVDELAVSVWSNASKLLRDFDWIAPVRLQCIHFTFSKDNRRST